MKSQRPASIFPLPFLCIYFLCPFVYLISLCSFVYLIFSLSFLCLVCLFVACISCASLWLNRSFLPQTSSRFSVRGRCDKAFAARRAQASRPTRLVPSDRRATNHP